MRLGNSWSNLCTAGAFLLSAICLPTAPGQPSCVVEEERRFLSQIARFSVDGTRATLTMPTHMYHNRLPTIFLEMSGESAKTQDLFLECCGGRVPLKHGASLQLAPKAGERILFAITTSSGQQVCVWQPSFRALWQRDPPNLPEGFHRHNAVDFQNVGDPIVVSMGNRGLREFRIDGRPAMVLSRTEWQVILRDPEPSAGSRVVESDGYSTTLRFASVEKNWSKPDSRGRVTLTVRVPKLELWGRHYWQRLKPDNTMPKLYLINLEPTAVDLRCGESYDHPLGLDSDQAKSIRITADKIRNGTLTVTCRSQLRGGGQPNVDVGIVEHRPLPSVFPQLSNPIPR